MLFAEVMQISKRQNHVEVINAKLEIVDEVKAANFRAAKIGGCFEDLDESGTDPFAYFKGPIGRNYVDN